jgi:hypothetical protein
MEPGDQFPIGLGAAGKVIVAFTRLHDRSHDAVRKRLIVHTVGETAKGMAGIAAPVFATKGFLGALTISGPEARFDKPAVAKFEKLLLKAAREVSKQLGDDLGCMTTKIVESIVPFFGQGCAEGDKLGLMIYDQGGPSSVYDIVKGNQASARHCSENTPQISVRAL